MLIIAFIFFYCHGRDSTWPCLLSSMTSNSIDDVWGKPFMEPQVSTVPSASPLVAARVASTEADAERAETEEYDEAETGSSTEEVTPSPSLRKPEPHTALEAQLAEQLRLLREESARQTYCIMALLAFQGLMLFLYLDRLHGYIRLQRAIRD